MLLAATRCPVAALMSIVTLLFLSCATAFNLYKSSDPARKSTTELFDRLKYHEVITFTHNQFHEIDTGSKAVYPRNGRLSFTAFGRDYHLIVRQNRELFSDSFHTETHRYNYSTRQMDKQRHDTPIPQCYYTAQFSL